MYMYMVRGEAELGLSVWKGVQIRNGEIQSNASKFPRKRSKLEAAAEFY